MNKILKTATPLLFCLGLGLSPLSAQGQVNPWFVFDTNSEKLDIFSVGIGILPNYAFSQTTQLKELSLNGCKIEHIEEQAFFGLEDLQTLKLTNNLIDSLAPSVFRPLLGLESLEIELGQLEKENFKSLKKLKSLYIPGATFVFDPNTFTEKVKKTKRQLSKLGARPFAGLHALEELRITGHPFDVLETNTFADLPALRTLDLTSNKLNSIEADAFSELKELRRLNLASNPLQSIDKDAFRGLHTLEALNIGDTQLKSIDPAIFAHTPALKKLAIWDSELALDNELLEAIQAAVPNCKIYRAEEGDFFAD